MEKYIVFDIETTGLNPAFEDKVTCICAKDSDGNEFYGVQDIDKEFYEEDLITGFLEWLGDRKNKGYLMVTCNGIDFDIPFILLRMIRKGIISRKEHIFLSFEHFDIQRLTYKKVSLNDMAILFNCSLKSGNGKDAIKLFNEKRLDELKKYCMNDVKVTEEIYLKLREKNGKQ